MEAREHESTLADVHGSTAALAHGDQLEQAAVAANKARELREVKADA
jgi:hypothetical protein